MHAGAVATIADHTAGGAACSLVAADEIVLSVEYKINFLRPAASKRLRARADVLRAGQRVTVAESSVFAEDGTLVAKTLVTLATVKEVNA